MSSEDEDAVEAELNELISVEHQKIIDTLPIVESDHLPEIVSGNYQSNYVLN